MTSTQRKACLAVSGHCSLLSHVLWFCYQGHDHETTQKIVLKILFVSERNWPHSHKLRFETNNELMICGLRSARWMQEFRAAASELIRANLYGPQIFDTIQMNAGAQPCILLFFSDVKLIFELFAWLASHTFMS